MERKQNGVRFISVKKLMGNVILSIKRNTYKFIYTSARACVCNILRCFDDLRTKEKRINLRTNSLTKIVNSVLLLFGFVVNRLVIFIILGERLFSNNPVRF